MYLLLIQMLFHVIKAFESFIFRFTKTDLVIKSDFINQISNRRNEFKLLRTSHLSLVCGYYDDHNNHKDTHCYWSNNVGKCWSTEQLKSL